MTPSARPHILAIDDDPAIRGLVADYLSANELRVTTGATGADMARALDREAIDLVVLDLKLPGEDGMLLARKLRETSAIPIIIVTGKDEEADRVMGLELGADDYITKPFRPRELLARIRAVLRRSQAAREPVPAGDETLRAYRFAGWELNLLTRKLVGPRSRSPTASSVCCRPYARHPSGFYRVTNSSTSRACMAQRFTIAQSTCRSCACAERSRRIRRSPISSRPNGARVRVQRSRRNSSLTAIGVKAIAAMGVHLLIARRVISNRPS